jgi:Uma2 family endonuclease
VAMVLHLEPFTNLDDERQFQALCQRNPHLRIERDPTGALVVSPPSGWEGSQREVRPFAALVEWNERTNAGYVFGSSLMYRLPGRGWRMPDASWVSRERARLVPLDERHGFPPIAPDFAIEVASPSDDRALLHAKMAEYVASGVRLAWLLDADGSEGVIYRPGRDPEAGPLRTELSGEDVLPGFRFRWQP